MYQCVPAAYHNASSAGTAGLAAFRVGVLEVTYARSQMNGFGGAVRNLIGVTLLLLAFTPLAQAQTSQATQPITPVRDPQAVAVVQNAIGAMGGALGGQLQNAQVQGTLAPAAGLTVPSGRFTWTDDFSGATYEFRHEVEAPDSTRVVVSGHGSPAFQKGSTSVRALRSHITYTTLPYYIPIVVLARALADSRYSVRFVGQASVSGRPAAEVSLKVDAGVLENALSEQKWFFDSATGLPLRVEYRLPSTVYELQSIPAVMELSDYRMVGGVTVPFTITSYEDGAAVATATISSVAFNVAVASSDFDLSAGGGQ